MSTDDINTLVHNYTVEHGGIPAPLAISFPKSVCTSVNDAICHGIPDPNQILPGWRISSMLTLPPFWMAYYADASRMFLIGNVCDEAEKEWVEVIKDR